VLWKGRAAAKAVRAASSFTALHAFEGNV